MNKSKQLYEFKSSNVVTTDEGQELSVLDDDYEYYKQSLEDLTNPLSDDYNKYDNE